MKLSLVVATTAAALVGPALVFAQQPKPAAAPAATAPVVAPAPAYPAELKELKPRASYSIGFDMGKQFSVNEVEVDLEALLKGLKDGLAGKGVLTDEQLRETMMAFRTELAAKMPEIQAKKTAKVRAENDAFFKANGAKPGVVTRPSGLQYKVIKEGTGPAPKMTDSVSVHYTGRLVNGTEFDSSRKSEKPATFPLNGVIPGFTEALLQMKVGGRYEVFIPSDLGYGAKPPQGAPIPPNSVLIFDLELISIAGEK